MFKRNEGGVCVDPVMENIRIAARTEGWTGMAGFKEWAKEHYNATLRAGKWDDWSSISFPDLTTMARFKQDMGVE